MEIPYKLPSRHNEPAIRPHGSNKIPEHGPCASDMDQSHVALSELGLTIMARGYVKEFCKPQEAVEVGKTCDDDPSLCNKSQLCGQSLTSKSGKAEWRIDNVSYVTEAKKRGLSCGVKAETTSVEKTCYPTKPEVCSNRRLCFRSTEGSGSSKIWATGSYFWPYVKEAKKRGLDCDVDMTKPIKKAFKNESVLKRKQLQYALKKLNYYKSTIDAVYGPGTEKALTRYASAKGININNPEKIFRSVLSQVSVPSSFETAAAIRVCKASRAYKCTDFRLCYYATTETENLRVWNASTYGEPYVKEARRRGLKCGVGEIVKSPKANNANSNKGSSFNVMDAAIGTGTYLLRCAITGGFLC